MYPKSDSDCSPRALVERRIVRSLVDEILGHGLLISVDDGEEEHPLTNDREAILDALIEVDEDRVNVYYQENDLEPSYQGQVFLVYGNDGWDVICDYSISVEKFISKTNALAGELRDVEDIADAAQLIRQGNL